MIRLFLAVLLVLIYFIFSIITIPICYIIGIFDKRKKEIAALRCVQFAFRAILFISGTKIILKGKENVITDRAALYTLNHRSFFDILITYIQMKLPTGFISKKEIKKVPFLNFWMIMLNCIFLNRSDPKSSMKTVIDALNKIRSGCSICICPEGTRNKGNDNLLPFKNGSFKIATKADAPIVPTVVYNTNAVFEDHFPRIKSAKVYLEFLEPIETAGMTNSEKLDVGNKVYKLIYDRIDEVKKEYFS